MFPYFSYRDANAALGWLESAFGFEKVVAYPDEDGTVVHAEMRFGNGALMMGTAEPPPVLDPDAVSPNAHGIYVTVDDVDAHYERAREAGAKIVYPPQDTEFGTRRYRVLDPEGYEWSFGTYRPAT
ncbi:hypothetical protein GBA63_04440 [Rubrobacter tropicus]|uniref:VOC domain-containing protein n=1 Tax=Rubrobacter tropicus TaxID=2653851 RepID=A0A6G8Q667_9ACTN|nr:VOC family protein [Rubrobacter tropicus]QIN81975.1 hypothetical protein GBA63_04440 [Rubrobacter tropicus]